MTYKYDKGLRDDDGWSEWPAIARSNEAELFVVVFEMDSDDCAIMVYYPLHGGLSDRIPSDPAHHLHALRMCEVFQL